MFKRAKSLPAPVAQETDRTGFLLRGEKLVKTGKTWKCLQSKACQAIDTKVPGYWAAGPGERSGCREQPAHSAICRGASVSERCRSP